MIQKMKKSGKLGFTMAELLIVVAIIAVLVAVAVPIFTSSLERAQKEVSVANLRSGYAEAAAKVLEGTSKQATVSVDIPKALAASDSNAGEVAANLPFDIAGVVGQEGDDVQVTFTFPEDGTPTASVAGGEPLGPGLEP